MSKLELPLTMPLYMGQRNYQDSPIYVEFKRARFFTDETMQHECQLGDPCGFVLDTVTGYTLQQRQAAKAPVLSKGDTLAFYHGDSLWGSAIPPVESGGENE